MEDGDGFRLEVLGDELAGGRALQAVQADGAEDQLVAAGGDVRAGGSRGDHQDAFVLVDVGRWLGGAGAEVANDELDAIVDDLVGNGHGLFRIAGVVVDHTFKLLAVYAASLVDLLDGHFRANELHLPVLRDRAGHRAGKSDLDSVCSHRIAGNAGESHGGEQLGKTLSTLLHNAPLFL
ncbi:hypothetical protein D3C80_1097430 [compost metagenome]